MIITNSKTIFWLCLAGFIFITCKSPDAPQEQKGLARTYSVASDTIIRNEVQKQVEQINSNLNRSEHTFLSFTHPDGKPDSLEYWLFNGRPVRISYKIDSPEAMVWPTFFLQDGQIILVRFRNWLKLEAVPWAEENMIYYKEGQAFYCDVRRMDLPNQMTPANVRELPFTMSPKELAEIEQEYLTYWKMIKEVFTQKGISL